MSNDPLARRFGWAALIVFAAMALASQVWIRPDAPMMPQSTVFPYSDGELVAFRAFLVERGLLGFYTILLLGADGVFIVLFAIWSWRSHSLVVYPRWRRGGQILAVATLLADASEGILLTQHLGLLGATSPLGPPFTGTSDVYPATLLKLCLYVLTLLSVHAYKRRPREDTA